MKKTPREPDADNRMPKLTNEFREKLLAGLPPAARGVLENAIQNGLGGAIGYPGGGGMGFPGNPYSEQLSDPSTLFKNLRWFLVSNYRQMLSEAYVELGLIQTICRVPVDDALRGGIELKSKQLSEDQVQELQVALDRDDDLNTVAQACIWNRLYGGAGIIILTDQDPGTPFELSQVSLDSPLEFRAVDMWELFWAQQNTDELDPTQQNENFEFYNYYSVKLHKSRVMRLKGLKAPSFIRPRLRGWGFSVVETLVRSINQYLKATDLSFEVLDEFKLDVFKIKNLVTTLMSPGGQQSVQERIRMANWQKNYQNALVMDSEDEFDHKQLSFSGLAETMGQIRLQVAADMRMPVSKLFGSQGGGLNSDDETDLEVYNAMIESEIRSKIKYDLLRVCEIKCQKLFGSVPDDLSLEFAPLRVLGAVDEETIKTQKFTRASAALTGGAIDLEEFRDIMNRDELLGIQLKDNKLRLLEAEKDQADEAEADAAEEDDSTSAAEPKVENRLRAWTRWERSVRFTNSAAFDRASYEADGGDSWIDDRRAPFFENPIHAEPGLWKKAKEAGVKALGSENWKFTTWYYFKMGGKL